MLVEHALRGGIASGGTKHLERAAIRQGVAKTKNRPVFNRKLTKQTMIVNCKNRPLHGRS